MRLVLRGDAEAADAGIQRVGQSEVDDAGLAAEIDGRFGATVRQLLEATAAPTGQNIGHRIARQRLRPFEIRHSQPPCFAFGTALFLMRAAVADFAFPATFLPSVAGMNSSITVASGGSTITAAVRPPSARASTVPPLPLPEPP